jgi:hypothetical protein
MSKPYIDYSQYDTFWECEYKWYERYISQIHKRTEGQRDDALTLGSLFHSGLESLRSTGVPTIGERPITEFNPTRECYSTAQALLLGYCKAYPKEDFTTYYLEQPVRFPISEEYDGLAKIDSYFHIDEITPLADGLGGEFSLTPGWWIKEYKTKDASRNVGNYVESWRANMQASFQMLALQHKICEPIQGIIVDVAEKPARYIPKRTCKGCKIAQDLQDWLPTGTGYACPTCGNVQDLDTSDKSKVKREPKYYRINVTKTKDQLDIALREMEVTAQRMQAIRNGDEVAIMASKRCVHDWFGPCEYWPFHANSQNAQENSKFVKVEALRYVGEV